MSTQNEMKNAVLNSKKNKSHPKEFFVILSVGFVLHLAVFVYFALLKPVHVDEALTFLNARSIADSKTDILGEKMPIYFDTWLRGGQSPFATYLTALFIKAFGYSLVSSRAPMFIFGMIGLVAFYKFLREIIKGNDELINIAFLLACISPWHLYYSAFVLDCNYLPHIMMLALFFLARGINTSKGKYFAASLMLFGIGFYCYIAAAIIIPVFLASLYLILIFTKKISLKNTIVSVASISIVSIPFILQGLVQFDVIGSLTLCGISIEKMEYYSRTLTFGAKDFFENIVKGFSEFFFIDDFSLEGSGTNSFNYASFPCTLFVPIAAVSFIFRNVLKRKKLGKNAKAALLFAAPGIASCVLLCGLHFDSTGLYAFNFCNYIFILIAAFGLCSVKPLIKKNLLKFVVVASVTVSLIFTSSTFAEFYAPQKINSYWIYTNSMKCAVDFAHSKGYESIGIVLCDENLQKPIADDYAGLLNERVSVILRFYEYDQKDKFVSLREELLAVGPLCRTSDIKPCRITKDNSYYYITADSAVDDDCVICNYYMFKSVKYDKNKYNVENFKRFVVIYKK